MFSKVLKEKKNPLLRKNILKMKQNSPFPNVQNLKEFITSKSALSEIRLI